MRSFFGIVLGIAAYAIAVLLLFTGLYFVLGLNGSFKPDSYEVTTLFGVCSIIVGFFSAALGGSVCAWYTESSKVVLTFGVIALAMGLVSILLTADNSPETAIRPPDVNAMEAMGSAQSSPWANYSNPVVALFGALAGGWFVLRKRKSS